MLDTRRASIVLSQPRLGQLRLLLCPATWLLASAMSLKPQVIA